MKIKIKTLQKKLEHLQRDKLIKKRGGKCEMCKRKATVADHFFSRRVRQLFFDERNISILCQGCHTKKTFNVNAAQEVLRSILIKRIGGQNYFDIFDIAEKHETFPLWSKRWWLEEVEERLL